jgi:hypothetical protein
MGPIAHTRGWSRSPQVGPFYSGVPRPLEAGRRRLFTRRPRLPRKGSVQPTCLDCGGGAPWGFLFRGH